MDLKHELRQVFIKIFENHDTPRIFFAPGRVNLIGEHTDYNGGWVFPCALSLGTYCAACKRDDQLIRVYSTNFEEMKIIEFSIEDITYIESHDWANYPKAVVKALQEHGYSINRGFDALYYGNLPNGAGLSSSASIELATAVMLKELFNLEVDMITLVKLSQRAENRFIGVNCGMMDQFAAGMGKKGKGILLNCKSLEYRYAAVALKDHSILIANTNKKRALSESKYNERRRECQEALEDLKVKFNIASLCELTTVDFQENQMLIKDERIRRRAKHVIYENSRTLQAYNAIEKEDIFQFGRLLNESHQSLRDDYEVSCFELDTLVEQALLNGAIGARMTGAGFGGCTLSVVKNAEIDSFIEAVGAAYEKKIGYQASFYIAVIGDGAGEVKYGEGVIG